MCRTGCSHPTGILTKTRLLYRYLIPKLNKKLYDASNDIGDQNGLEGVRVIMDKAGKIPENAEFIWNIDVTIISREKDGRLILCRTSRSRRSCM